VTRRTACFVAGLAAIAVAVAPPVETVTARHLSAHMVQHLVLMLVAAPLLAAGQPVVARLPRLVTHPVVVLTVFVGGFWAWHLPHLYQVALSHTAVHMVEHATFLLGAFLFWSVVLDPGSPRRLGLGATCGFVFAAMLTNIWLAAGLAFATTPLYDTYVRHGAQAALADQQLAGVIMWVPADIVYFVTLLWLFSRLLRDVGARMRARDAAAATAFLGAER
jgi:cytochrome c oxidase assembly factor CtaG